VKAAYAVKGHSCDDDADDSTPDAAPGKAGSDKAGAEGGTPAKTDTPKLP